MSAASPILQVSIRLNLVQEATIEEYLTDLDACMEHARMHSLVGRNAEVLTY